MIPISGNLRHKINIMQKVKTADGGGGFTESRTIFLTTRAEFRSKSVKEQRESDKQSADSTDMFFIRRTGSKRITQDMEIDFYDTLIKETRTFHINGIIEINNRRYLQIQATERF